MSKIFSISININNKDNISITMPYICKTTFNDLLEMISYSYPAYDICPCFSFQYREFSNYYSNWRNIQSNSKISDFRYKDYKYKIINNNKTCTCSKELKDNYKKSKIEIINIIEQNINIINGKEKKINQLTHKSKELENTNDLLKNDNNLLKSQLLKLNELNDENSYLKNKYKKFEEKIKQLENNITSLNEKISHLNLTIKNLNDCLEKDKLEIEKLNVDNKRLIQEKELLEYAINGDVSKINELKKLGITGKYLRPKENTFQIDKNTNQFIINKDENKKINFEDFYDVIVDIKSIKDITKGWKIKMSKRAKDNYEKFKENDLIKIGVIGNANKGKSFLLSKISKINLPSGTSIRTEGLSIKYPEINNTFKNRIIALLDSAGLETPVLKEENENYSNLKDFFKEKSREKLITELFLQNYIIHNSDILIVVVGIFTYSEQKLLNRIKTEMQRAKINKPLIVIHNLMTYTTIDQVKEYINLYLLKSVTFTLKEKKIISTKTTELSGIYFYEINNADQKNEQKIFHFIFANEGSEAGNYYNNLTLDFLENSYQSVINLKSFDVIQSIKERFLNISNEIIQKTEKTNNNLKIESFDNQNNEFIKLNIEEGEITLKKCLIDELGFSNLKGNGFEPTYNYYKNNNKIIVKIEGPGNTSITRTLIDYEGEYTILKINGLKKKDKEPEKLEDNIYNSREFGDFSINIPLKIEEYIIKNQDPVIKEVKGEIVLEYLLEEKKSGGKYIVKEENEV